MMGRPPPQIWGDRPQSPSRSPPMPVEHNKLERSLGSEWGRIGLTSRRIVPVVGTASGQWFIC